MYRDTSLSDIPRASDSSVWVIFRSSLTALPLPGSMPAINQ